MVAALSKFHHRVHEVRSVGIRPALGEEREVTLQNGAVILFLNIRQLHLDNGFLLWCQTLLDVLFQPSQHHRFQQLQTHKLK